MASCVLAGLGLTACTPIAPGADSPVQRLQIAPPDAPPGTCWDKAIRPAVIETRTQQVLVQTGDTAPAVYRTETRQEIVRAREESWFETLCASQMTPQFIATLQRALIARGHYKGPVSGVVDRRTRQAIRAFQAPAGEDSGTLSLRSARQMGLIAVSSPSNG